jgi:hypothetical protein
MSCTHFWRVTPLIEVFLHCLPSSSQGCYALGEYGFRLWGDQKFLTRPDNILGIYTVDMTQLLQREPISK